MTLGNIDFRNNAIGFLRLFFATSVVWSHAYLLGGFGGDPIAWVTHGASSMGLLSVGGFFVLSGFLITRSCERVGSVGRYLWHRCLRIFPGYWVCLIALAFGFAPLLYLGQHGSLAGFFSHHDSPWGYVLKNWFLLEMQQTISGPYPSLSHPDINGSLWTLQWEFGCYLAIAVLGVAGVLKRKPELALAALLTIFAISATASALHGMQTARYGIEGVRLFLFFALGACAYLFRYRIAMRWPLAILAAVVMIVAMPTRAYGLFAPLCLSYLTLFAAMKLPIRSFDRRADLSYGVYIYAFPIQQLLAMHGVNRLGVFPYFLAAMAAIIPVAAVSWFAVERPCLSFKNYTFARMRPSGGRTAAPQSSGNPS